MDCFDNFSVLAWNIRGAFSNGTKRHIRDLIRLYHPSIFCVFETHGLFMKAERFWTSIGYKPLFIHEARGHSGGIWVLSCSDDIVVSLVDNFYQMITFNIQRQTGSWTFSAVYASPLFPTRCELWDRLKHLRGRISGAWLLIGDFNEILHSTEVSRGQFRLSRATLFVC